jgi:hypothetical protein
LLGSGYSMNFLILVESVEIFLHLGNLILEVQQDAMVHVLKASV